jgi:hypothetical protein
MPSLMKTLRAKEDQLNLEHDNSNGDYEGCLSKENTTIRKI